MTRPLNEVPLDNSLTWNLSAPDGRATFHLERTGGVEEPVLVWRRIGDHSI